MVLVLVVGESVVMEITRGDILVIIHHGRNLIVLMCLIMLLLMMMKMLKMMKTRRCMMLMRSFPLAEVNIMRKG
ncbi:Uncharacterised protein [Mycobacteroides abscessus subsp. abscessus]|nr:Uncharacterised protein [Mycobacteroides abscessus subsp. abscessus]